MFVCVRGTTLLAELTRKMIDTCSDQIIVLDKAGRPIGIVLATDVLKEIAADNL